MSETRKRLNVLHVATINKPIMSDMGYGPIETVIYNIDKGLSTLGHRSIVACSSDSVVTGQKYPTIPRSLGDYLREDTREGRASVDRHLAKALARARRGDIDVVHMHEWFEYVCDGRFDPGLPIVTTLHVSGLHSGIEEFRAMHPDAPSVPSMHYVAISEYQRRQYAHLIPVAKTIPHGLDTNEYPFNERPDSPGYLFNIGRITSVKGQDSAIDVAKKSGSKLILAGCVQEKPEDKAYFERLGTSIDLVVDVSRLPVDRSYYEDVMKPILSRNEQIVYIGELSTEAKKYWFRHARATLFPIRWGEPFGMVLIESMASGTPVLAFREGSVPEIVIDGVTGFVVNSAGAMVQAVERIEHIDRRKCRRHVEECFSMGRMAESYAELYAELAGAADLREAAASGRSIGQESPSIQRINA
jgi:glycosyltransferase involved in cell wall biosynthesis